MTRQASLKNAGFAVFCDSNGIVRRVIHDDFTVLASARDRPLPIALEACEPGEITGFLGRVRQQRAAFNAKFSVRLPGFPVQVYCHGCHANGGILVVGSVSREALDTQFFDEIMHINSEHVNHIRALHKRNARVVQERGPAQTGPSNGTDVITQMTALNNELVNLQRQLAKKNIQLSQANRQLELFVEAIPDGVVVATPSGTILLANRAAQHLFERAGSVPPRPRANIHAIADNGVLVTKLQDVIQGNANAKFRVEALPGEMWVEIIVVFARLEPGEAPFAVIVEVHDITEHVKFDHIRQQFISSISHELKTPVTSINLSLQNYRKYGTRLDQAKRENLLAIIEASATVLTELIEDLLTLSRVEASKLQLKPESFRLAPVLDGLRLQLEQRLEEKELTLHQDYSPDLQLHGDPQRVTQILRILLDNAIKYTHEGGRITVAGEAGYWGPLNPEERRGTLLSIQDTGMGIPPGDLPHVLERFYRGSNASQLDGTGLGLAIALELAKLHGGEITVESQLGEGTTVHVFLPCSLK